MSVATAGGFTSFFTKHAVGTAALYVGIGAAGCFIPGISEAYSAASHALMDAGTSGTAALTGGAAGAHLPSLH